MSTDSLDEDNLLMNDFGITETKFELVSMTSSLDSFEGLKKKKLCGEKEKKKDSNLKAIRFCLRLS